MTYVIAVTVLYARSLWGGEEKQLTMFDVSEPEGLEVSLDTSQRNRECMCVAVDVKLYTFFILVLDGDEWLVSCFCHFNP